MFKKFTLVCCVYCLCVLSLRAQEPITASTLAFLSKTMYDEGNINYLVVDALRDSLLQLGKPYTVMIKTPDHLRIMIPGETKMTDQPKMPVHLRQQYFAKFDKFLQLHKEEDNGFVTVKSDSPLTPAMIEDPNSPFRSSIEAGRYVAGLETIGKRKLVLHMLKDKIITLDDKAFVLAYSSDGIDVNNTPLEGDLLEKYKKYFHDSMGIDLYKGLQSGNWSYDKGVADAIK